MTIRIGSTDFFLADIANLGLAVGYDVAKIYSSQSLATRHLIERSLSEPTQKTGDEVWGKQRDCVLFVIFHTEGQTDYDSEVTG